MKKYKNLFLLGTNHISSDSKKKIEQAFKSLAPDVVCLELDRQRYNALFEKKRSLSLSMIKVVGFKGFLFMLIGRFIQSKLAKKNNNPTGIDMITASRLSKKYSSRLFLIDQNIVVTLRRFNSGISKQDKKNIVFDIFSGILVFVLGHKLFNFLFSRTRFGKKALRRMGKISFDINKIPADSKLVALMDSLKKAYPSIYKIFVDDRNKYMASNLIKIMNRFKDKKILVIVGAGHIPGIIKILESLETK